jgi:flagellar hook-associated protein 1 FlgK
VQGPTAGPAGTLALADVAGTPLATLGLAAGLETGSSGSAAPRVKGAYTGTATGFYRFEALGSGTVGVTAGLQVAAYDPSGARVAVLDVGAGYAPGAQLAVADGITVALGSGDLRQASGDFFALYVTPDPDQGRLLAGIGLNVLFTGSDASDIEVSAELLSNPGRLGTHRGTPETANIAALLAVRDLESADLGGLNGEDWVLDLLARVGNESATVESLTETGSAYLGGLQELRASVSGVSIEEELLQLSRYQNLFESTLRVTQVIDQVMQEVFALVVP